MGRIVAQTPFAEWLNAELEQRGWGVRTLAKRMNPAEPEVARRALNRYLFDGSVPSDPNRLLIAGALDVEEAAMPTDAPFRGAAA